MHEGLQLSCTCTIC